MTPSFFIIGAQKAGTTTLHHWLASHPQVCLPDRKETHFFSHDERFSLGASWYHSQFSKDPDHTILGEIDPEYLFFEAASKRISQLDGSPRFVVVVREPLARAYSHYCMSRSRGLEPLSFAEALAAEEQRLATGKLHHLRHHSYMARSQYTHQIIRYQERFGPETVLVLTFDDLFDPLKSSSEYQRICQFIGLSDPYMPKDVHQKYNEASVANSQFVNDLLWRKEKYKPMRKIIRRLIPLRGLKYRMGRCLDNLNQKRAIKQALPFDSIHPRFVHIANQETHQLSAATGLDLAQWAMHGTHR